MTKYKDERCIELTVTNPEAMHHAGTLTKTFGQEGGTIGSQKADWILLDTMQGVAAVHCEVVLVDGAFCLIDRSGLTRMNRSESGMGLRRIALLRDGDMVTVGACRIAVRLVDHAVTGAVLHEHASPPSSGVFMDAEPGDRQPEESGDTTQSPSVHGGTDFFADAKADERHVRPAYPDPAGSWDQPFIASHRSLGEALHGSATDTSLDARAALRALHPTICFDDDDRADGRALALIADAGECIRQAVSGISDLYKADDERGRGLIPRSTLHAIEDNPLRLGQDRDATLRALFSPDRSPVLLSGPAAIQECFAEARRHNLAVIQAIDRSLDVVLGALSPDNLKKRFVRYGVDANLAEGDDARCWHMYGHYHAELAAPRQNGFARLFWDVFDQAYDQAMRAPAVTP